MTRSNDTSLDARAAHAGDESATSPTRSTVRRACARLSWIAILSVGGVLATEIASAQVESSSTTGDDSPGYRISDPGGPAEGWSARLGAGFTAGPDTFLLNFEAPYAFNEWIAVGPMLQLGLDDDHTIAAPTLNVTLKYPELPGVFDRVIPYAFGGLGLAVIKDDRARNDDTSVGFLIDVGMGAEYQLSDRVFVGTQMMLDFLPKQTQGQKFIFAWQIGGLRYAF